MDEIGFEFDGDPAGKLSCAADGESLRWSPETSARLDVGKYGTRELFDRIDGVDMDRITSAKVSGVDVVLDDDVCVGIALKLNNGSELLVLNCGDELAVLLDRDHGLLHESSVLRRSFA